MAKTYEELLEQAAVIRDETAAGKNTATRVGGTITDAVDYVKELQDTYAGIHAEAAEAKTTANAAKTTAEQAKLNATSAMNTARSASLNAAAANGTANEAKTESAQAVSTAQEAKDTADAAKTTAEQAKKSATNAFDSARSAVFTATAASGTANEAKTEAAAAQTAAETAQTTADALLRDTQWAGHHMNEFTETGEYHIHGERTDANDGLPIINSGSGHTIDARLTVLDSSLTRGTGEKTDIVVTQILRLSNRTGGDGHVYVRTAQAKNKSQLATPSSTAWGTWEKLMGVFEKNAVTNIADLDTYTTNGMYSGLFADTTLQTLGGLEFTPGDTFLLITVNGYAASAFGTPQLTQMLYKLPSKKGSGNTSARMYMRTAYWDKDAEPKAWVWANWDRLAMASEISGGGGGSIEEYNTLIGLITENTENIAEVREAMITNISVDRDAEGVNITVKNTLTQAGATLKIPKADAVNNKAGVVTGTEINALHEIDFAAADVTNIGFEKDAEKNKITLTGIGQLGDYHSSEIELTPATSELAGLMSAADKIKLDSVESTANDAKSAAETAQTAAQEAKNAAETAQATATAAQEKNEAQDARLDNIEARIDPDIAGRVWNEDNGTPKAESYYGSVKALRDLPKRLGLGRYIVKDDRTRRKLDPNDSTKYLDDGSTANLDGRDGQCMWCWNGFYANIWHEGSRLIKAVTFDGPVGNDISIWIPAGGISWLGAGVIDRGDAPFTDETKWKLCSVINNSEQFIGGGGAALNPDDYSKAPAAKSPQITMLGMPATMMSTTKFGEAARRRSDGWEANWFVARFVVEFLFEVIMGTENSQEAFNSNKDSNGLYQGGFGTGVTDMPDWVNYNGNYPVIPTSVGLEAGDGVCLVEYNLPDASGGTYKTFNVPVFFGLVGAGFGNLWSFTRGVIMVGSEENLVYVVYVTPSMYADYYPNTVADKILVAECPNKEGYIKRKSYQGLCCMPTEVGGSETTRFADYFYNNPSTSKNIRFRAAGNCANGNTHAGTSSTNTPRIATLAHPVYSAPLCYFTEDPIIPYSQSIANNN